MSVSFQIPGNLPALLAHPKATVTNRIRESIDAGQTFLNARVDGPAAFNSFRANRSKWDDQNREMLRRLFISDAVRAAYDKVGAAPQGAMSPAKELEGLRDSVADKVDLLQAILDGLEGPGRASGEGSRTSSGNREPVFVIHVDEPGLARNVARVLDGLKYTPILVSNRARDDQIDAQQMDAYRDARFAVVLMAGDQIPGTTEREPHPETVLWYGYVAGRLGQKRVCALYQPGVRLPGKDLGLRGIEYDEAGAWKTQLAKRLDGSEGNG